jgi:hypothetical protein
LGAGGYECTAWLSSTKMATKKTEKFQPNCQTLVAYVYQNLNRSTDVFQKLAFVQFCRNKKVGFSDYKEI